MLAYFDCYSGISGDMTLGALVDLGVEPKKLEELLKKYLRIRGFTIETKSVKQCGLRANRLNIVIDKKQDVSRRFSEIRKLVADSTLPKSAKEKSLRAFQRLAKAEAAVHGTSINKVHFHEVGSLDAIIDITGSMLALDLLKIDEVYCSYLPLGCGEVQCQHGTYPVPAPATLELLRGIPAERTEIEAELVTPTGAAIITTIAKKFGAAPLFKSAKIGYGAGSRVLPGRTNFLRITLGEPALISRAADSTIHESLNIISTEIDDVNPEIFSYIFEQLFLMGCLDVHLSHIQMKKNRPGISLKILAEDKLLEEVIFFVLRETPTFGLKVHKVDRYCLKRKIKNVRTKYGNVKVKLGYLGEDFLKASPEYESCRQVALRHKVPIVNVYNEAIAKIEKNYSTQSRMKK